MGFIINQSTNLLNPKLSERDLGEAAYLGDSNAHTWRIEVLNCAGWLKNKTAKAVYSLPNGSKQIVDATIEGDEISTVFPGSVYSMVGDVSGYMKIVNGSEITTIAVIRFTVSDSTTL